MATGSLARLYWRVFDAFDYWLTQAMLWAAGSRPNAPILREGAAEDGRLPSTPLRLGLAGLDHHRQASPNPTRRWSTKCQPSDGELATATDTVAAGAECPLESADPIQIGAPGEEDRQIERDDPGEQTEGQTEGEASAPADAGDWLSLWPSLTTSVVTHANSHRAGSAVKSCQFTARFR
jgi:hypothetical protein